jgi:D-sedoheptulose 7-phosphate isomerase
MNSIDKIFQQSQSIEDYSSSYIAYLGKVLGKISLTEIEAFVQIMLDARTREANIYFIGNGGSAATASHFANDIAIGTRSYEIPFRVVSLCDNNALITAVANDDGYDEVFRQQLKVLMRKHDVVVAISASGNSQNLLNAIEYAKQKGAITVGLTAFDGGKLRDLVKFSVHVPTEKGEYGPAEDAHMMLDHLVSNYLSRFIKEKK